MRRPDLSAAVLGIRAPYISFPSQARRLQSPVSSASHLRLQHHSRQIGFGAHPRHGKIPARPLRGAGRGQIPRCQPHPVWSRPAEPSCARPRGPGLCPAFAKLSSSEERAPGTSGADSRGAPAGSVSRRGGSGAPAGSAARPSPGPGAAPPLRSAPPPPLRPALPPDPEPREFCRASRRPALPLPRCQPSARPQGPPRSAPAVRLPARGQRRTWRRVFPPGGACLLACSRPFQYDPPGLGSPFSEYVLPRVNLDGGRARWEEPVGVASRRQEHPRPGGAGPGRSRPCQAKPSQACGLCALTAAGGARGAARLRSAIVRL